MKSTRCSTHEEFDQAGPGAFWIGDPDGENPGLWFNCPHCGRPGYLPLNRGSSYPGPKWTWDGNRDAPTLTPSILNTGDCKWHGYLTAGVWREC